MDMEYPQSHHAIYYNRYDRLEFQGEVILPLVDQDIRTDLEIIVLKNSNQYRPTIIITQ